MADQNLKIQLTAIDKTQRAFAAVRGGLKRVSGSILNVRTALVGLAGAAGLQVFAKQIDDLAKASSRLGLTVNELQSLQFAASQTGASAEELEKGLTRFSRSISEASSGIGTGLRAFEALGITVTDAQGGLRPTSELLNEVSDRLTQIQDPADRVRIAFDLFGRSGVNLVNTLQQGSGSLKQLQADFNAVTLELTGKQAKAVEEANDLFDKLGRTFSSIGMQITATFLPTLAKISEFLVINFLRAINAATRSLRNFLNSIVELAREVGIEMEEFTFGVEMEKNLNKLIKGLEATSSEFGNATDNVTNMREEFGALEVPLNGAVKGFRDLGDLAAKNVVTFDEFGDRIGIVKNKVDTSRTALEKYIDSTYEMDRALQDVTVDGLKGLEDSFANIVTGTSSVKDAFRNMANSIVADLARIAARKAIGGIVGGLGGGGGLGGIVSGLFGGKAIGGSVQRGQPYMVGERGAEMFVPNQAGSIVPNNQLGGGAVTVNQTVNLTTGVAQTVRTEVMNMLPQIQQAAVSAVLDARRRGGSFGSAFGG
jgi:hypothetical protein